MHNSQHTFSGHLSIIPICTCWVFSFKSMGINMLWLWGALIRSGTDVRQGSMAASWLSNSFLICLVGLMSEPWVFPHQIWQTKVLRILILCLEALSYWNRLGQVSPYFWPNSVTFKSFLKVLVIIIINGINNDKPIHQVVHKLLFWLIVS